MTTNGITGGVPNAKALLNGSGYMELNLQVSDPELVEALSEREDGSERHDFAVSALKIGAIALRQAQGNIDADSIRKEGMRIVENVENRLESHRAGVTKQIGDSLREYFDPNSGRFNERVNRLIENGGDIERVIRQRVEEDGRRLVDNLGVHIGVDSPLMRTLDPNATNGLVMQLRQSTEATLTVQREAILSEFSLDNSGGALKRMVDELTKSHGEVSEALKMEVASVKADFSLDNEDSALSRLIGRVELAQKQISSEFSLDAEGSALARMQKTLLDTLERQRVTNERFHVEVTGALEAMKAREQEAKRGTRHGLEFEDAVFNFVSARSQKAGDFATETGTIAGRVPRSRVGDAVIELGAERAAAGSKIVVEAKKDGSYTLAKARAEIEIARKNRDAEIGLFVFSSTHAPYGLESFNRLGDDIFVVWDSEDTSTDVVFDAGLSVALALCTRAKAHSDKVGADIAAIEEAIIAVEKQVEGFDEITRLTTTIKNNSENVLKRARIMSGTIERQIEILNDKVGGLR